jgi:hypothetical protein
MRPRSSLSRAPRLTDKARHGNPGVLLVMKLLLLSFFFVLVCFGQLRINSGGPAYTDALGQTWQADQYFTGGSTSSGPTPNGAPLHFATKRYGDFSYVLPVPDGMYSVSLYLIENAVTAAGARSFSVTINGTPVLDRYDLAAEAGPGVPTRKQFPVVAAGGGIRIQFRTAVRSAFINAIEVLPAGGGATVIASGAKALDTSAIEAAACTAAQTAAAAGVAPTDVITAAFNRDPAGVAGYVPRTGMLTIMSYPTVDTVNFRVCNNTNSAITPGAVTINWQVLR